MSNVQVKNLDEVTHDALRERAAAEGRTISEYVLELIRSDLRKPTRAVWLERLRALPSVPTTTDEILDIRERGHDR
ncbi:MAG: hypothetical protein ABIR32_06475 [Ilumatobacteraceae bacterium]